MISNDLLYRCLNPDLTEEEAIQLAHELEKIYDELTPLEIAYIQINQKLCIIQFSLFHSAVEKVLEQPVFTHEFGFQFIVDKMKERINQKWEDHKSYDF